MSKKSISHCRRIYAVVSLTQFFLIPAIFATSPTPNPEIVTFTHTAQELTGSRKVAGGHFENPSVSGYQERPSGIVWNFQGEAGIISEGAAGQGFSQDDQGAYLTNNGSMAIAIHLEPGVWQLSFEVGQQRNGANYEEQRLRITAASVEVLNEIVEGPLTRIQTKPFRVVSSNGNPTVSVTLGFSGNSTGNQTVLIDDIGVERLGLWTDSSTWVEGQAPTTASHNILIPANVRVAIDQNATPIANHIVVNGLLTVVENNSTGNGSLTCSSLLVNGPKAELRIGLPRSQYRSKFEIQLAGNSTGGDIHFTGTGRNFLIAMNGGLLSLHGRPVKSHTTLASTAIVTPAGTSEQINVFLADTDGWKLGDTIWISPSFGPVREGPQQRFGWDQGLTFEIVDIDPSISDPDQRTLTLSRVNLPSDNPDPADRKYLGATYSSNHGLPPGSNWTYETRSVVALRNRNLVIRGIEPGLSSGFGGHVMVMGRAFTPGGTLPTSGNSSSGIARISNVQFESMGQKARLGRYPFHWHMLVEDGANQYLKECVINNSFNRAIVIHGTHNALVDGNVAIDHIGHGLFLEDGAEINNTITRNVIALSRRPAVGSAIVKSDNQFLSGEPPTAIQNNSASPAAFWISNPYNTINDNIAVATHGSGYWFVFNFTPTGASKSHTGLSHLNPRTSPLISFDNNSAFATALAFDVNDDVDELDGLKTRSNYPWLPPGPQELSNMTVWANDIGLYAGLGTPEDQLFFRHARLIGNGIATRFAAYIHVEDSLFVADTADDLYPGSVQAVNTYDGAGRFHRNHYVGYSGVHNPISPTMTHWLVREGGGAAPNNNWIFSGSSFDPPGVPNMSFKKSLDGQSNFDVDSLIDEDGTLTQDNSITGVKTIVSDAQINWISGVGSFIDDNWKGAVLVTQSHANLQFFGAGPTDIVTVTRKHLSDNSLVTATVTTANSSSNRRVLLPIVNNNDIQYFMSGFTDPSVTLWFADCKAGDYATFVFPDFAGATVSRTTNPQTNLSPALTLSALQNSPSTAYFIDHLGSLYLKYVRVSEVMSNRDQLIITRSIP